MHNNLHPYYLQQMGIETWTLRQPVTPSTKLMVIGESLDDNKQASNLFTKMLNSIGLPPEDVIIKSTLTDNLLNEITKNPPKLLLAIGKAAIQFLLNNPDPLNTLRGKVHDYHNKPLVVSYHPTDLLQQPIDKKNAWQDLLLIQKILA